MRSEEEAIGAMFSILRNGQEMLQNEIEQELSDLDPTPEAMYFYALFRAIVDNPEKTNWSLFMESIEVVLNKVEFDEHKYLIEQYILEGFANSASNDEFDLKWIKECIGPKAKVYIASYDKFIGAKIATF